MAVKPPPLLNIDKLLSASLELKQTEKSKIDGAELKIRVQLPSEELEDWVVRTGYEIERLKTEIAEKHALDFAQLDLLLNGTIMPDPMTVNEFPALTSDPNAVIVVQERDMD